MNYGHVRGLALSIYTFGVVQLRQGLKGHMKENWTREQLVDILLGMLNDRRVLNFMIPQLSPFRNGKCEISRGCSIWRGK